MGLAVEPAGAVLGIEGVALDLLLAGDPLVEGGADGPGGGRGHRGSSSRLCRLGHRLDAKHQPLDAHIEGGREFACRGQARLKVGLLDLADGAQADTRLARKVHLPHRGSRPSLL